MNTQPAHSSEPNTPRVPHTIGGIAEALRGSRRAEFFAELLRAAQGRELDEVLVAWWGRAMLDSDPDRDRATAATKAMYGMRKIVIAELENAAPITSGRE